jgi:hypothetical protein
MWRKKQWAAGKEEEESTEEETDWGDDDDGSSWIVRAGGHDQCVEGGHLPPLRRCLMGPVIRTLGCLPIPKSWVPEWFLPL